MVSVGGRVKLMKPGECWEPSVRVSRVRVEGPGGVRVVLDVGRVLVSGRVETPTARVGGSRRVESVTVPVGGAVAKIIGVPLSLPFAPIEVARIPRRFSVGGYEVLGVIGVGGFGVTLLAKGEGERVVLKVPKVVYESIVYGSPRPHVRIGAFFREARVLVRLSQFGGHPHIVRLVDFGYDDDVGAPFLVFEYAENGSLRGVLSRAGRLSVGVALRVGVQVASALEYLHRAGIVHRDLKPENVLFDSRGVLKVSDFNISRIISSTTSASMGRLLSPGYGAPEIIMPLLGRSGPWSDVWSLGIMLVEMITGELPFPLSNYEEAIVYGEPVLDGLPGEVRSLVERMLVVKPEERISLDEALRIMVDLIPLFE